MAAKRLIDANALIDEWNTLIKKMRKDSDGAYPVDFAIVISAVSKANTVDAVEVVHGRWKEIEASDELYQCSACGEWQFIPEEHFAYCPYCGAKMDGDGNG